MCTWCTNHFISQHLLNSKSLYIYHIDRILKLTSCFLRIWCWTRLVFYKWKMQALITTWNRSNSDIIVSTGLENPGKSLTISVSPWKISNFFLAVMIILNIIETIDFEFNSSFQEATYVLFSNNFPLLGPWIYWKTSLKVLKKSWNFILTKGRQWNLLLCILIHTTQLSWSRS